MSALMLGTDAAEYLRAVGAALADLPDDEREEMLDDLRSHLTEIAGESDTPLSDRLGPPAEYAAELRAAAGFGPAPRPTTGASARLAKQLADAGQRLGQGVRLLPGGTALAEFLPQLRPGWWVLRGYLVVLIIGLVLGFQMVEGEGAFALIVLGFPFAVASVWLGRHPPRNPFGRVALALLAPVLLFLGLVAWQVGANSQVVYADNVGYTGVDLSSASDLLVYDADGRLLRDVQLFDENGVPIQLPNCPRSGARLREDGSEAWNVYPRAGSGAFGDACGNAGWRAPAQVPALRPTAVDVVPTPPTPSTSPSVSATPSTSASASATPSATPSASASPTR